MSLATTAASALLLVLSFAYITCCRAEHMKIGRDISAFHEDELAGYEKDYGFDLEDKLVVGDAQILVELVGIPNFAKINAMRFQIRRADGLRGAFAFSADGYSTIVYDPNWARSEPAEFRLILGHEAGHVFCGHTTTEIQRGSYQKELEADRFAGASIKRFEIYQGRRIIEDVMAAAFRKFIPPEGSKTHPPRTQRIEAVKKGYEQGSPCGNLAPVDQGPFGIKSR